MPTSRTNVFVSYSHADAPLVAPVVKLLRVNKSLVFQDVDDIRPGKKWRDEIARGLVESDLVVVFWCHHASRSEEVSREWDAAIAQGKDVLPLLLDATPLPPKLGDFQWIDFRGTVGHNHSAIGAPSTPANRVARPVPRSPFGRHMLVAGLATVFVAAVGLNVLWTTQDTEPPPASSPVPAERPPGGWTPPSGPAPKPAPKAAPPPPSAEEPEFLSSLTGFSGLLVALALLLAPVAYFRLWRRGRRQKHAPYVEVVTHPAELQKHMASEIETEIIRRTAQKRDLGAS